MRMRTFDGSDIAARWGTSPNGAGTYQGWANPEGTNTITALLNADSDGDPDNGIAEGLLRVRAAGDAADGGAVVVQDETGTTTVELAAEASGGIVEVGNSTGFTTIKLDGGVSGDAAVEVPQNAVSSMETAHEAGVASTKVDGVASDFLNFDLFYALKLHTITCPDDGFVLVIGTCQLTVNHYAGTRSFFELGVTDEWGVLPPNQDVAITIPASEPDGNRAIPVTVHGLFRVDEGDNTFYMGGYRREGAWISEALDVQLTLLYFPTAYGVVDPTLADDDATHSRDDAELTGAPASNLGTRGHGATIAADQNRYDQELEQVRSELAELRALIERDDR